jgi:hypothetical protein
MSTTNRAASHYKVYIFYRATCYILSVVESEAAELILSSNSPFVREIWWHFIKKKKSGGISCTEPQTS